MKNFTSFIILLCCVVPVNAQIINIPGDHSTIQAGIDAASDGDTVLVAEGTYLENIRFIGKAITVASQFILDGDTSHISRTIIDGSQPEDPDSASVVIFGDGEDSTTVLCGFTVTGGKGTYYTDTLFSNHRIAGGILVAPGSGGKIEYNIIRDNHLTSDSIPIWGGGIMILLGKGLGAPLDRSVLIQHNIIRNNSITSSIRHGSLGAGLKLGAAHNINCRFILSDNIISHNEILNTHTEGSAIGGGMALGIFLPTSPGVYIVNNNEISYNKVSGKRVSKAGGIFIEHFHSLEGYFYDSLPAPLIYNNLIHHNESEIYGGGIVTCIILLTNKINGVWELQPTIINNTIVDNKSPGAVGIKGEAGMPFVMNNILWNDLDSYVNSVEIETNWSEKDQFLVQNNNIQGGWGNPEDNNVDCEPWFKEGSYDLSDSSCCIGLGIDSFPAIYTRFYAPEFDYYDSIRPNPIDTLIDLGAIESPFLKVPNADLTSIDILNYTLKPSFHKDSLLYVVDIPDTVTATPGLDVVAFDWLADIDMDPATNLVNPVTAEDSTTTITVTAHDGITRKVYTVVFNRLSTEISLNELSVSQGTLDPEFDPAILDYTVLLHCRSDTTPLTTCTAADPKATIEIIPAPDIESGMPLFRTTSITVTSEAGIRFKKTYLIEFNVDNNCPELTLVNETVGSLDSIRVSSNEDGKIYLVPAGTEQDIDSITTKAIISAEDTAGIIVAFPVSDLEDLELESEYWLYGVDSLMGISDPVMVFATGLGEIIAPSVRIYPVPFSEVLTIESDDPIRAVELYNVLGVKVLDTELTEGRIHLGHLEKGIYCIRVTLIDNQVFSSKVVKK